MPGKFNVQRTRTAVLLLLAATALATGLLYVSSTRQKAQEQPAPPADVPPNVAQSAGFNLSKSEQGKTLFTVKAARARELKDSGKSVLEDVEIITYGAQGNRHDRISSKLCEYDSKTGRVHSEGEVEIELAGLPGEFAAAGTGPRPASTIYVKTSGLTFEEKTAIATTTRQVEFRFARGTGRAVGAVYDSNQRTLLLKSAVEIVTQDTNAASATPAGASLPTEIKAAELVYLQRESQMRLQRPEISRPVAEGGRRRVTAEAAVLALDEKNQVRGAEVTGSVRVHEEVTGAGERDRRETTLLADRMELTFSAEQQLERALFTGAVALDSKTPRGRWEARAGRLDMHFNGPENELHQVEWRQAVRMVMAPSVMATAPGGGPGGGGDTRIITSEAIEMFMAPGGRDLDVARTLAPGRVELVPAKNPGVSAKTSSGRRVLTAGTLWMKFAGQSQLRVLTAEKNVRLESEIAPDPARKTKPAAAQRVTTSDTLAANFGIASQQIETLEQTGNFQYTEGEQRAAAERALYTAANERVDLSGKPGRNPEVWDATTRTSARAITLDERNDEGTAVGEVRSVHLPENKDGKETPEGVSTRKAATPGPLSGNEPVHVISERMVTNSKTGVTRYEGGPGGRARLWQKQDVIQARRIVLEREARRLTAEDEVTTVLVEESGAGGKEPAGNSAAGAAPQGRPRNDGRPTQPLTITAQSLVYTDSDRRAHYERDVRLRSRETTMKSTSLDAWLLPSEDVKPGESRLERAVSRGSVEIVERQPARDSAPARERRAEADVAEYITAEEKMTLSGGDPYIYDEQRGFTKGRQLTYYRRDDRIFVHGDRGARTETQHRVPSRRP